MCIAPPPRPGPAAACAACVWTRRGGHATPCDVGTYFFFLFLTTLALSSLAFLGSALSQTAETARGIALAFYVLTFVTSPVLELVYFSA